MTTASPPPSFIDAFSKYKATMATHRALVYKSYSGVCSVLAASDLAQPASQAQTVQAILEAHLKLHRILFENLFYNTWDALKQLLAAYDQSVSHLQHDGGVEEGGGGGEEQGRRAIRAAADARRQLVEQPSAHIKFMTYHRPPVTLADKAAAKPEARDEVAQRRESLQTAVARRTIALSPDFSQQEMLEGIRYAREDIGCSVMLPPPTATDVALRSQVVAQYFAPSRPSSRACHQKNCDLRPTGGLDKLAEIARRFSAAVAGSSTPPVADFRSVTCELRKPDAPLDENSGDTDLQRLLELLEESAPPPQRATFQMVSQVEPSPSSAASPALIHPATWRPIITPTPAGGQLGPPQKRPRDDVSNGNSTGAVDLSPPVAAVDAHSPMFPVNLYATHAPRDDTGRANDFRREESQVVAYMHSQAGGDGEEWDGDDGPLIGATSKEDLFAAAALIDEGDGEGAVGNGKNPPTCIFQLSLSLKDDKAAVVDAIQVLGGVVDKRSSYSPEATHFVVAEGVVERTEKYLSFCAARKAIVTPRYVLESAKKGAWIVDDRDYNINPQLRLMLAGPPGRRSSLRMSSAVVPKDAAVPWPFEGWKVWLFSTQPVATGIRTILSAGGCQDVTVFPAPAADVAEALRSEGGLPCLGACEGEAGAVTHFLVEPTIVPSSGQSGKKQAFRSIPPAHFPPRLQHEYAHKIYTLELLYHVLCLAPTRLFDSRGQLLSGCGEGIPASCRVTKP